MKITIFNKELKYKGDPIPQILGEDGRNFTLFSALSMVYGMDLESDNTASYTETMKRQRLSVKLWDADEAKQESFDLEPSDLTLFEKRAPKCIKGFVVFAIDEAMQDKKEVKETKKTKR